MKYSGMTVNERLYQSGLMNEYDKAVKGKNEEKIISILTMLEIDKKSINAILNKIKNSRRKKDK
ncbi:MAG TPA: hypothetical protein PKL70_17220 [Saprospiraceae bacterium]|nr:hypothetical protein [Saprospiraceae bacterium]